MSGKFYVLALSKPWALEEFRKHQPGLPGEWSIVSSPAELEKLLSTGSPRYIFFPHWSDRVPEEVTSRFECVCFHMTDLPYGRGGSPLQNLIASGHKDTMLTALRMTPEIDAGPIYAKRPLPLDGSAAEIFDRAAPLVCELIEWIVRNEPEPQPQTGTPTEFKRRNPEQSRLPSQTDASALYDHIRMLDAPRYPKAFLEHGEWRLEFDQAKLREDGVEARVSFRRKEGR
jgi:methionyl-tRNA formyltransferase